MLAQIELRIEDPRGDPGVLEEVVPSPRFGGGVGQGAFCGEPRDEVFGIDDGGCGEARPCLFCAEQHLNGTPRFWAQTGKFILREQALRANLGQHR
jgi:hypothetical protein